jgi:NTE family protein
MTTHHSSTTHRHFPRSRALILGGGGSAGNAWLIGVIAGLLDAGLDVTDADLIVGTSAGATAAAQITGPIRPAELLANISPAAPALLERSNPPSARSFAGAPGQATNQLDALRAIIASADDASDMRRNLGAATLAMHPDQDQSGSDRWRSTVAARLPGMTWPERLILITAIDAFTGEPVVFDRDSGVELIDAVAASTSNGFGGPPFAIGPNRYLDGGYRRNENADLAIGFERVLVLSPLGGRTLHPLEWGMQLAAQVDELRAAGSLVETVLPDEASLDAFGGNMMDPSTRPPAARAGYGQGRSLGSRLASFWR